MATITFSHQYLKMPSCITSGNCKSAKLIEVLLTTKERLSQTFIEYDTKTIHGDYYPLPSGRLMVLLLLSDGELWTTVRSFNPEKEEYYRKLRGQMLNIEINRE